MRVHAFYNVWAAADKVLRLAMLHTFGSVVVAGV